MNSDSVSAPEYLVRANFLYTVNGLLVESSTLGTSVKFSRDGAEIEIRLPTESDPDFPLDKIGQVVVEKDNLRVTSPPPVLQERVFSDVYVLLISVRVKGTPEAIDDKTHHLADDAIRDFIEWHRLRGQTWLGLHGQAPKRLSHERFLDEATGRPPTYSVRIDLGELSKELRIDDLAARLIRRIDSAADSSTLSAVNRKLVNNDLPSLADQMLADAMYFGERHDPEFPRALLFAAIACELKIKEVLQQKASPETRQLVEVLLNNPRDFSMQVSGLFDKALKAALGLSLREADKALFKRIDKLFILRNRIAHQGHAPDDQSSDCISAARAVFDWLDRTF